MALILTKGKLKSLLAPLARGGSPAPDHLTEACRAFINRAPLVCLATSNARGEQHLAPLGGQPGFAEILDHRTLLLPEWPAPESRQQMTDLLDDGHVGLLFLVPGEAQALEVSGTACLSDDGRFLDHFRNGDGVPEVVILIEVTSAAFVGEGAIAKSGLWQSAPMPSI